MNLQNFRIFSVSNKFVLPVDFYNVVYTTKQPCALYAVSEDNNNTFG